MSSIHSFHIPVMGIGFTIDTPLKVSPFGIDSVISMVDDILLEKLRKMYCQKYNLSYSEISKDSDDFRAQRITSYLNLIKLLTEKKFENLKEEISKDEVAADQYFSKLPAGSVLGQKYIDFMNLKPTKNEVKLWLDNHLEAGSIDVNIMTKVDKVNYKKNEKLATEYNDAHAALRGFALSDLNSSLILSAGLNPRLYSYIESFEDFYPDKNGFLKKKIALKVSDFRSALIQGKFLAKKGIWVSEFRVESGLNCGGHAFASDGYLLGPILEEFKEKKEELRFTLNEIYVEALKNKKRPTPTEIIPIKITAQGGVGTSEEHEFLLQHYNLDSIGWGTPFLLVPEVTNVDESTLNQLINAREKDLYLSNISPLGVPFNSLRGNTKDIEKQQSINNGKPGSKCPKKYVALNNEYLNKSMCTASRQYQYLKINELDNMGLSKAQKQIEYDKIVDKSCICVGLGTAALIVNNLDTKTEGPGVSVCPGPNMAYFSKKLSLDELVGHIYGKNNVISRSDRPNLFVKELDIYTNYIENKIDEMQSIETDKQKTYFISFIENLLKGISYYRILFDNCHDFFGSTKPNMLESIKHFELRLNQLSFKVKKLSEKPVKYAVELVN